MTREERKEGGREKEERGKEGGREREGGERKGRKKERKEGGRENDERGKEGRRKGRRENFYQRVGRLSYVGMAPTRNICNT